MAEGERLQSIPRQIIMHKLADSACDITGRAPLFMIETIMHLRAIYGDDALKAKWGDKYEENISKLNIATVCVGPLIHSLTVAGTSRLVQETNVNTKEMQRIRLEYTRILLLLPLITNTLYTLIDASEIKTYSIPREYLSNAERQSDFYDKPQGQTNVLNSGGPQ